MYLSVADTKIYYTYKPSDVCVVFLHGWVLNHTEWTVAANLLQKHGFGTLNFDLRGHGYSGSPKKRSAYTMKKFTDDVYTLLQHLKIKKAILVGHSMGGMIIIDFLKRHPAQVQGVVLADSPYENPFKDMCGVKNFRLTNLTRHVLQHLLANEKMQRKHFKEVDFSQFKTHNDIYYFLCGAKNMSPYSFAACLDMMLGFDDRKSLSKIKVPALIIEGTKDFTTPLPVADYLKKHIKKSQLVFIQKCEHDTPIARRNEVAQKVLEFVKTVN